jgi:hypothetical protein
MRKPTLLTEVDFTLTKNASVMPMAISDAQEIPELFSYLNLVGKLYLNKSITINFAQSDRPFRLKATGVRRRPGGLGRTS